MAVESEEDPSTCWDSKIYPQGRDLPIGETKKRFKALEDFASQRDSDEAGNELFARFAPEFTHCTTGEMKSRPVPQATREPTPQMVALRDACVKYLPRLVQWLLARATPRDQAFDTKGRIGYPAWKVTPRKLQTIRPYWDEYLHGDYSSMRGQTVIANVRTQPERTSKVRKFTYVDKNARVYAKMTGPNERKALDGWFHMRTRLVFCYPVANTLTQLADSLIHNVFLASKISHFTSLAGTRIPAKYKFFADVSHMERTIGVLVDLWSSSVGGGYHHLLSEMLKAPFIVPTDDWSNYVSLTLRPGAIMQLGSGVSPVTSLAKAAFWIAFAIAQMRMNANTFEEALELIFNNRAVVGIMNYGDDNVYYSDDKSKLDQFVRIVSEFFTLEEEVPPAFLGHAYDEARGFELRARSYLANFWLAERRPGSIFRPYPHYGFMMRRKIYAETGQPSVRDEIIPAENAVLARYGVDRNQLMRKAQREQYDIGSVPWSRIVGKEYLLTEEEKAQLPDFQVMRKTETLPYLRYLLGDSFDRLQLN